VVEMIEKCSAFISFLVVFFIFFGIHRNDCYDFHVWECNECHKHGLGYALCSGFCVNISDIENPCYVDLIEKCEDEIPHGCNLPENEYIDGWCIPFTEICWWF